MQIDSTTHFPEQKNCVLIVSVTYDSQENMPFPWSLTKGQKRALQFRMAVTISVC